MTITAKNLAFVGAGAIAWFGILAQGFQPSPKSLLKMHASDAGSHSIGFNHRNRASPYLYSNAEETNTEVGDIGTRFEETGPGLISRRSALLSSSATTFAAAAAALVGLPIPSGAAQPNGLKLSTAPNSGLRWADARVGSGEIPTIGSGTTTSIDYSMASTAGRFPSIYSTKNGDEPYRWKLGDGSTIRGIEMAILGDPSEGIPPMRPGGIRRVIVPNSLGYNALIGRDDDNNVLLGDKQQNLSPSAKNQRCLPGAENSLGPIPPKEAPDGAYQRWYQFYCNPRIPYQPDLVLDIKLYGKRGSASAAQ